LGVWPAVALFFAMAWTELVFPSPAVPAIIARLALGYSLLTWAGMALFGSQAWLRNGEVFTIFFGLFARFAPTEPAASGFAARPFAAGLLSRAAASPSEVALILLVLASVLFDGLLTTPEWAATQTWLHGTISGSSPIGVNTLGLVAFWLIFLAAYLL